MASKTKKTKGKIPKSKAKHILGRKHKKGNRRKTSDEIERAFAIYAQKRSERDVKQALGWTSSTIKRYKKSQDWDRRCAKIDKKVEKSTDNKVKRRRVRNISVLDVAIDGIAERMENGVPFPIDKLGQVVKVQSELLGQGGFEDEEKEVNEETKLALKILEGLPDKALKALGDEIALGNLELKEIQ